MVSKKVITERTVSSSEKSGIKPKSSKPRKANSGLPPQKIKSLVYRASGNELKQLDPQTKRFYLSLSPEAKEVFAFLYFNPISEIIAYQSRLRSSAKAFANRTSGDEYKMGEMSIEIARYAMSLECCQDPAYQTLVQITLGFYGKSSAEVIADFKGQLQELKNNALESGKKLSKVLNEHIDQINKTISGSGLESALQK